MKNLLMLIFILVSVSACKKDTCQTCTKTIGGIAGNFIDEVRGVCSESEAKALEESSSGTTVWKCD